MFENYRVNYIWYPAAHDMRAKVPSHCKKIFKKEKKKKEKDSKKKKRQRKKKKASQNNSRVDWREGYTRHVILQLQYFKSYKNNSKRSDTFQKSRSLHFTVYLINTIPLATIFLPRRQNLLLGESGHTLIKYCHSVKLLLWNCNTFQKALFIQQQLH